ncbi:hypothetical protein B6K86_09420 [Lachnospiraceae bacterium]|nr:hypothetical protein B6K86_09420 [Lachnospiraceae bacterium]
MPMLRGREQGAAFVSGSAGGKRSKEGKMEQGRPDIRITGVEQKCRAASAAFHISIRKETQF